MPRGVATNTTSWRSASRTGRASGALPRAVSGASSAFTIRLPGRGLAGLRFERHDLREQRPLQVAEVERLLDEIVGPEIQRLQGHVVVGVAADHDDRRLGDLLPQLLQR